MLPNHRKPHAVDYAVLAALVLNLVLAAYHYGQLTTSVQAISQRVALIERMLDIHMR